MSNNYEYILIDSYKRSKGSTSDFTYELNRPVRDIEKIELVYSSLSNTILTFTSTDYLFLQEDPSVFEPGANNKFYFEEQVIDILDDENFFDYIEFEYNILDQSDRSFTLIEKNLTSNEITSLPITFTYNDYTMTSPSMFVAILMTILNDFSQSQQYVVSYPNNKLQIVNQNSNYTFSLDFSANNSLYHQLGFEKQVYDFTSNLTSPNNIALEITPIITERSFILPKGRYLFSSLLFMLNEKLNQNTFTYLVDLNSNGHITISLLNNYSNKKVKFEIQYKSNNSNTYFRRRVITEDNINASPPLNLGFGTYHNPDNYYLNNGYYIFNAPNQLQGIIFSFSLTDFQKYDITKFLREFTNRLNYTSSDQDYNYYVKYTSDNKIKIYNDVTKFKIKLLNNDYLRLDFTESHTFVNEALSGSNRSNFESNVVSIPFENASYSSNEFIDFLKTKLNSEGRSGYNVTLNEQTFKITFSNATPFKLLFSYPNSVYRRLGFKNENTELAKVHVSNYVSNLEATDYILVQIRNLATVITNKDTSGTFFIPIISSRYEVQTINENQSFNQSIYTGNLDLSNLDIKILDDEGELIKSNELNLKLLLKCYK